MSSKKLRYLSLAAGCAVAAAIPVGACLRGAVMSTRWRLEGGSTSFSRWIRTDAGTSALSAGLCCAGISFFTVGAAALVNDAAAAGRGRAVAATPVVASP
eukprot:CAMPEP_0198696764 /NCGR_PEP_ID=MMETSP1468-20131203/312163_1 /TAXON_ID=1461545 /ORGANISM="Mantoniella sp, Strain CCMP1436" /LENGTH=99 /DNA_ID=CAMNT_0044453169 /DNA_START=207 /DNA_END=502 /DNA_ORIENTATION=-